MLPSFTKQLGNLFICASISCAYSVANADVLNLGGVRNPDGTWTGLASLETVTVGNPGNAGEISSYPVARVCGAVNYTYNIGKYEVTTGQYTAFLNAVASDDPYSLYSPNMWSSVFGCKIQRLGTAGNYTYSVASDWANRPVNFVSWGDAARFSNWLANGQPTGPAGPGVTETGTYTLNGRTSLIDLAPITRNAGATWAITSEDEWYKAAYYDPALNGGAGGYWTYPTRSNTSPDNQLLSPDPGNNANFQVDAGYGYPHVGHTIGAPYYRTEVGEFENSPSAYGTFDQGGNVSEWNESVMNIYHMQRGGSWSYWGEIFYLHSSVRMDTDYFRDEENMMYGFRVSLVPEPATYISLLLGGASLTIRRRSMHRLVCSGLPTLRSL